MITFFVPGEPRPKQSYRASRNGGGFIPAKIKAWQSDVGWIAQKAIRRLDLYEPLEGNLTIEMTFFLGNARRVDSDNLSKAVQDGLNGIVWDDDQQNIRLVVDKYICHTKQGVLVRVYPNERAVEIDEHEMNLLILEADAEIV